MVMMVVYHVVYDINFLLPAAGVDPYNGVWRALQVVCGSTFLTLVGISFWISHERAKADRLTGEQLWRSHLLRGFEVLAAATVVSIATRVALGPDDAVRFGILHLIAALMIVVLPLTVRLGRWNAILGAAIIAAGLSTDLTSDIPGLLALGFEPPQAGVDWYPLMPWGGAALLGVALGSVLYPCGRRGPALRALPRHPRLGRLAAQPGRRSLPFYLVHQPVLVAVLGSGFWLFGADV